MLIDFKTTFVVLTDTLFAIWKQKQRRKEEE
jgi:hypothetical protein